MNSFVEAVAEKAHNLGSDTIRCLLTSAAPSAAHTVKADLTEIATGNGYTSGGPQAAQSGSAQSSGLYKLTLSDTSVVASGGSISTFRYVVLYNDTASNDELIGWYDYGTGLTITNGNTFVIDFDGSSGVLTLQ